MADTILKNQSLLEYFMVEECGVNQINISRKPFPLQSVSVLWRHKGALAVCQHFLSGKLCLLETFPIAGGVRTNQR